MPTFRSIGSVGAVLLSLGCSSSPIRQGGADARDGGPSRPADPICADAGAWSVVSEPLEWPPPGALHLAGAVDAIDLSLDADGTFRLFVFACDSGSCSSGVWRTEGDAVVVSPSEGAAGFYWPRFQDPTSVRLTPDSATTVQAHAIGVEAEPQTWAAGLICAACCGGLGPAGVYSCDEALPATCEP